MSTRSLNKVMLIGNLTRDPEVRYTTNGTAVATFGLATNKAFKDEKNELKELVDFHNIVAWGKMAEICQQILAKGMKVYIEGSLTTRSWQADSGETKYKTEVRVTDMILLDSKGKQGVGGNGSAASQSSVTASSDEPASDLDAQSSDTLSDPLAEDMPF